VTDGPCIDIRKLGKELEEQKGIGATEGRIMISIICRPPKLLSSLLPVTTCSCSIHPPVTAIRAQHAGHSEEPDEWTGATSPGARWLLALLLYRLQTTFVCSSLGAALGSAS
jgi:hypothetical protein